MRIMFVQPGNWDLPGALPLQYALVDSTETVVQSFWSKEAAMLFAESVSSRKLRLVAEAPDAWRLEPR